MFQELGDFMQENLLLARTTAVVCPRCEFTFSVEQGFAKQALDSLASQSARGIAELRVQERSAAEHRAQELYQRELTRQAETHAAALQEAKRSMDASLQAMDAREKALAA